MLICCWTLRLVSCLTVSHTHGWRNDAKSEYTHHDCISVTVVPSNLDWTYAISLYIFIWHCEYFYTILHCDLESAGLLWQAPVHHLLHSFPKICSGFSCARLAPGSSNSPCALSIQQCQVRHLQFWMTMKAKLARKWSNLWQFRLVSRNSRWRVFFRRTSQSPLGLVRILTARTCGRRKDDCCMLGQWPRSTCKDASTTSSSKL